jgi:hypothetical protein
MSRPFLAVHGILPPRTKGFEGVIAARVPNVICGDRPYGTPGRFYAVLWNIGPVFFRVSSCQMQTCTAMTGLPPGPLKDTSGLDAVRADAVSVVLRILGPPA